MVGGVRIEEIENATLEPPAIAVLKKLLKKYIWVDEKYVGLFVAKILVLVSTSTVVTVSLIVYPFTANIKDPLIGIAFFVLNDTVAVDVVMVLSGEKEIEHDVNESLVNLLYVVEPESKRSPLVL